MDPALNKDGIYYPQVFLKECKYIKKKVIRHIIDDLESSSDKEQINAMRLMLFENVFFEKLILEKAILKKCLFLQSNFKNIFFERAVSKMSFLREQFQKCHFWQSNFWKYIF